MSKAKIDRLSLYCRELKLAKLEGIEIISSEKLGKRIGISPEKIRKDLATFGELGKKGVGYVVHDLWRNTNNALGLHKRRNVAIIGAGYLGCALAKNLKFTSQTFGLSAIFDADPAKIGRRINGLEVVNTAFLEDKIRDLNIDIAVITTPAETAQKITDRIVRARVKGIWNFAPVRLVVPEQIAIVNEDLSMGLSNLSYFMTNKEDNYIYANETS